MLSSDAVVFGSNIAYLRQVKVGQVVQLNVTPLFPADMQLTVVSIAGRAISPTAPLVRLDHPGAGGRPEPRLIEGMR